MKLATHVLNLLLLVGALVLIAVSGYYASHADYAHAIYYNSLAILNYLLVKL